MSFFSVVKDIGRERAAQDAKWGEQNHPDLSPALTDHRPPSEMLPHVQLAWLNNVARYYGVLTAQRAKEYCEVEHKTGHGSWFSIHIEELAEALEQAALGDVAKMRAELVQLAATVTAHIEAIDRRN